MNELGEDPGQRVPQNRRDALDQAGISRCRENGFHSLRHYFASLLPADGVDNRALSEYRMRAGVDSALAAVRAESDDAATKTN